jgi:hypothetical protein
MATASMGQLSKLSKLAKLSKPSALTVAVAIVKPSRRHPTFRRVRYLLPGDA